MVPLRISKARLLMLGDRAPGSPSLGVFIANFQGKCEVGMPEREVQIGH